MLATPLKAEQKGKGIVKDGKLGTVVKARGEAATYLALYFLPSIK